MISSYHTISPIQLLAIEQLLALNACGSSRIKMPQKCKFNLFKLRKFLVMTCKKRKSNKATSIIQL